MIAKLQSPLAVSAFGLLLSVGVGVGLCWRAAAPMLQLAAAARPKAAVAEDKSKGWDFWTIEIENLGSELKEERSRLRKQAEALDQRAVRLANEGKELEKIRTDLDRMRREIGEKVIEITADEAKNIRSLAQTYGSLSPRAAVTIFREMDDVTAVKILSLMKADLVGPIFEEMTRTGGGDVPLARRAAVLSEKLRLMKSGKT
jgi:flagellar motility protein MotE (MotC chaperone)